jgi:predicted DNA-binding protein YlxM (UPF0122 family)
MKSYKEIAEEIGVSRPSVGRIVKRENLSATEKYDPTTRKITKYISDDDFKYLLKKYKV